MPSAKPIRRTRDDLLTAVQFLTRIPTPALDYQPDSLARATKFFPLVGILVAAPAALIHRLLLPHLSPMLAALATLIALILITGCFHEDGLADIADGLGGGCNRTQVLAIFRDSRIGTYGAAALILSLSARLLLLADLPPLQFTRTLLAAHVLCRWTTLPLSYFLPAARTPSSVDKASNIGSGTESHTDTPSLHSSSDKPVPGQGARIASLTSRVSLVVGSVLTLAIVLPLLQVHSIAPILATVTVTYLSGLYYRHRIQGVTGDTFGATNQLTEIAVYLCAVWT